MPTRWNKFKKKRRDASKRARGIVDNKLLKKKKIDLTAKEREFNELLVNGKVPTKRRRDGTILLREVTNDDGQKVADNDINQIQYRDILIRIYLIVLWFLFQNLYFLLYVVFKYILCSCICI